MKYVVSSFASAMRKAIQKVYPKAIQVLDHFQVIQLFTNVLEHCRKYLWTKHGSVRHVCRLLSQWLEKLTEEERETGSSTMVPRDTYLRRVYQAHQHFRYVWKSKIRKQAKTKSSSSNVEGMDTEISNILLYVFV